MNVAEYIASFLIEKEVRHVFGFQGGAIVKIVDAIVETGKIEYVQNFHEQASAFCADAYSRVTRNLGVALATSGPGATNLITGIANAQLDSIPTLFITGQEYSSRLRKRDGVRSNGFQDLDIVSVVSPITKYAATITSGQMIAYELEKALHLAKSGRPGAVLLDIPIDVQFESLDAETLEHYLPPIETFGRTSPNDVSGLLALLQVSRRPVILGGGGVLLANAREAFKRFAGRSRIPVALTLNGLDAFDESVGFSGLYGNTHTNLAVYNADLLIVLGARLGQHQVGKSKAAYTKAKIVHVDIDALELERCMSEELSIQADLGIFLCDVNNALEQVALPLYDEWRKTIATWSERYSTESGKQYDGVSPIDIVREVQNYIDHDTVVTCDVGQNQMWVAQAIRPHGEQRLLNSSGLGSMGYALPAAIAAKICRPRSTVVAFMGDGGFQINIQELQLIALKGLDIKLVVFNNGTLGLIKSTQDRYFDRRNYGSAAPYFACVDLKAISRAYRLKYYLIAEPSDMSLLRQAIGETQACLIEVKVDPDFPLASRNDMTTILEKERIDD